MKIDIVTILSTWQWFCFLPTILFFFTCFLSLLIFRHFSLYSASDSTFSTVRFYVPIHSALRWEFKYKLTTIIASNFSDRTSLITSFPHSPKSCANSFSNRSIISSMTHVCSALGRELCRYSIYRQWLEQHRVVPYISKVYLKEVNYHISTVSSLYLYIDQFSEITAHGVRSVSSFLELTQKAWDMQSLRRCHPFSRFKHLLLLSNLSHSCFLYPNTKHLKH